MDFVGAHRALPARPCDLWPRYSGHCLLQCLPDAFEHEDYANCGTMLQVQRFTQVRPSRAISSRAQPLPLRAPSSTIGSCTLCANAPVISQQPTVAARCSCQMGSHVWRPSAGAASECCSVTCATGTAALRLSGCRFDMAAPPPFRKGEEDRRSAAGATGASGWVGEHAVLLPRRRYQIAQVEFIEDVDEGSDEVCAHAQTAAVLRSACVPRVRLT